MVLTVKLFLLFEVTTICKYKETLQIQNFKDLYKFYRILEAFKKTLSKGKKITYSPIITQTIKKIIQMKARQ